jgi:rhamnosyltransferase
MKILGIVTSYFPNFDELEHNIKTYLSGIDHLIIWENTPKDKSQIYIFVERLNDPKVEVRTTGKNEFLAYPFNSCIKWASENEFTHILTMDQDSCFIESQFIEFLQLINFNQKDDIAIYTPTKSADKTLKGDIVEVENAITSGSVYPIGVFKKVGYFYEDFLIYMMDIEFGIRVKENGLRIICLPNIILDHKTGYVKESNLGFKINNYSAQSTYYIIRNTILTWKLYPHRFKLAEKTKFFRYKVIYRTLKIVFEDDKLLKIKAIWLGMFHGVIKRSGRYDLSDN